MERGSCWSVAVLGVLAAGCGPWVEYTPVIPAPRQLQVRGAGQVQIVLITPPARPHVDIGLLRVGWSNTDEDTLERHMELLRTAAGQHGCDVVVVTRIVDRLPGSIEGSCEVFTDVPAPTTSPPPSYDAGAG